MTIALDQAAGDGRSRPVGLADMDEGADRAPAEQRIPPRPLNFPKRESSATSAQSLVIEGMEHLLRA